MSLGDDSNVVITNAGNKNIAVKDMNEIGKESSIQLTKEQLEEEHGSFITKDDHLVASTSQPYQVGTWLVIFQSVC